MFKLNGKPLDLRPSPPAVLRLIATAKKLPNDELVDAFEMARKLGMSAASLKLHTGEDVRAYRHVVQVSTRKFVVFGNAKTIAQLKKSLESA